MTFVKTKSEFWNRAAFVLLVLWIAYNALAVNVFGGQAWPKAIVDYTILYNDSRSVVATHHYPPYYAYPPSSVVFQYLTALPPFSIAAALFMALTIVGAIACWVLLHHLLFGPDKPAKWGLVLLACLSSDYFFQWDLRSQNCNILFLASLLVGIVCLQQRRAMQAGFWMAVSIALKLFPVVLVPYLLWKGEKRALCWLLGFSLVFWLILPLLIFSPPALPEVYRGWLGELNRMTQSSRIDPHQPILISLDRSAQWLALRTHHSCAWIVVLVKTLWGALLLLGLEFSRRRGKSGAGADIFSQLTDMSLMILLLIALNAYLEPYHVVPFAIVALLLLQAGADPRLPKQVRTAAWITFTLSYLVMAIPSPFEIRGLIVNCKLLIALAGLLFVAWKRHLFLSTNCPASGYPAAEETDLNRQGQ